MIISKTNSSHCKESLMLLYTEAFGEGQSAQHIDPVQLSRYFDALLAQGYALLATEGQTLCGALLACPLTFDSELPSALAQTFRPAQCLYLAEMMVSKNARGQGLGQLLMDAFEQTADRSCFTDAFIRVWDQNTPALRLYLKNGYCSVGSLEQQKTKPDGKTLFSMNKLYLHKKFTE